MSQQEELLQRCCTLHAMAVIVTNDEELMQAIRNMNLVPVAVFAYDVENDVFVGFSSRDVTLEEANALLRKVGLKIGRRKSRK